MRLLRKKRDEIIDFTLLQKRGILKVPKAAPNILDLRPAGSVPVANSDKPLNSPLALSSDGTEEGFLGFLDNPPAATTSTLEDSVKKDSALSEVQSLKVKLDDLEYKLERLLEKLQAIENKVN